MSHRLILLLLWFPLIVATEARPDEPNELVRVGTYRLIREYNGKTGLGVTVFGTQSIVHHNRYYDYQSLVSQVARFLKTGKTPVSPDETLEEFAFMEYGNETDKLLTERTYRDFRLRFDYRFDRCVNNGIALRCPPTGKASALGLEVQLIDAEPLVTRG